MSKTQTVKVRYTLFLMLIFLLLIQNISYSSIEGASIFEGGSGTKEDPFLVATAEQLNSIRKIYLTRHYKQIADIDLGVAPLNEGEGFEPIGSYEYEIYGEKESFTGSYDGNNFKIKNLTINRPGAITSQALFGYIDNDSEIKNINLENASVIGSTTYTSGLVGKNDGIISNCSVIGFITGIVESDEPASLGCIGGLVAENRGIIVNSFSVGHVTGDHRVGGLVGINWGEIITSYSTSNTSGSGYIGGLAGLNWRGGYINNSFALGSVTGKYKVGGLAGCHCDGYGVKITNSFATGRVIGEEETGGLVGGRYNSTIEKSYYDAETTEQYDTGKGAPLFTSEMKAGIPSADIYNNWSEDIWEFSPSDQYPFIKDLGAPVIMITVTFKDYDDTVLKVEEVEYGSSVTAPADPEKEGYTFTGWDTEYTDVTDDITVTAEYEINEYEVIFKDWDDYVLGTDTVEHGGDANVPPDPEREGHTFIGWDADFSNVTSDLAVTALYETEAKTAVESLLDGDGNLQEDVTQADIDAAMALTSELGEDHPEYATLMALLEDAQGQLDARPEKEYELGDVEGTSDITVADAILVLRHIVDLITLEEDQISRAKVSDGGGELAVGDAILILRHIVGLIKEFPAQK